MKQEMEKVGLIDFKKKLNKFQNVKKIERLESLFINLFYSKFLDLKLIPSINSKQAIDKRSSF